MDDQPTISTHVLDTEHGRPAQGMDVALYRVEESGDVVVGRSMTDFDGRIRNLLEGPLVAGDYRIAFSVNGPFFQRIEISFHVVDTTRSYHVPLLLAPYSIASYRGS